jgi:hypothetical protein
MEGFCKYSFIKGSVVIGVIERMKNYKGIFIPW